MTKTLETPAARLKKARAERQYWYGRARMDTASLRRTLQKAAEAEMVCALIEQEIRELREIRELAEKKTRSFVR